MRHLINNKLLPFYDNLAERAIRRVGEKGDGFAFDFEFPEDDDRSDVVIALCIKIDQLNREQNLIFDDTGTRWSKNVPMYASIPEGIAEGVMKNKVVCSLCDYENTQRDYKQAAAIATKHMIKTGHIVKVYARSHHTVKPVIS